MKKLDEIHPGEILVVIGVRSIIMTSAASPGCDV
jgi:hypothetical protein